MLSTGARGRGAKALGRASPPITGTSAGAIGSASAQQHLRSVMTGLGMILLGGEAYVTFKPDLIDERGNIGDDSTKKFLEHFVDRFADLVSRLAPTAAQASAA
jgi:chromate reductase, NAD(P)H dehydrogenase (quinone)